MAEDTKSKIAELEKELYAKNFKPEHQEEFIPHSVPDVVAPPSWTEKDGAVTPQDAALAEERHERNKKMIKKILVASVGFFTIAAGIAGYVWFKGSNLISGDNISIDVVAPVVVAGGESFDSKFTIANNNNAAVDEATLYVEYPKGFYSSDSNTELPRVTQKIGSILPGQVATYTLNTMLYGEANSQKEAQITLEYRMAGSNATLTKKSNYSVKISSSPVNIKLEALNEVSAGQQVEFSVTIESNSKDSLDNLLLHADYPLGFTYRESDPSPSYEQSTWDIGTLKPQEERSFKIRGVFSGQEGTEGTLTFSLGAKNPKDVRSIGIAYNIAAETIHIAKPLFSVDVSVNGAQASSYTIGLGKPVRVDILWENNNPTKLTDVTFEASVKGDLLNRYSVFANGGGFYRSIDNTIVWQKEVNSALQSLDAGESGSLSFGFSPLDTVSEDGTILRNPQIIIEVKAHARRSGEGGGAESVDTFLSRKIKIGTTLSLAARSLYFTGPFTNKGPLPPRAENETTYTIVWTVRNTSSNASNVTAKTTLPIYMKWMNNIYPQTENVTYRDSGAEVTWNAGIIPAGGSKEVAFQVSLTPSLSQVGQTPDLTGRTILKGFDDFTKTDLSDEEPAVRTVLSSDPQFEQSQASVIQ